jgi:hypothetical protein
MAREIALYRSRNCPCQKNGVQGTGWQSNGRVKGFAMASDPVKHTGNTRLWHWLISVPLAGVLVYLSLRGVDWHAVWTTIKTVHLPWLGAGLLVWLATTFARCLRWRVLLNAEGKVGVATVFWANAAGYLGNNFLPARAGELIRSAMISSRSKLSNTYTLTTALTERVMDAITLIVISSLVIATMSQKPAWLATASRPIAIIGFAGAVAIISLPYIGDFLKKLLDWLPLPRSIHQRLLGITGQVLLGVRALHGLGRLAAFFSLTSLIWFLDATGSIILANALGLSMTYPIALLLLAGLGLGSALPATPGYIGIYQFVAVSVLTPFGFSRSDALAYILMVQAFGYVVITVLGLIGLWKYRGSKEAKGAGVGLPAA